MKRNRLRYHGGTEFRLAWVGCADHCATVQVVKQTEWAGLSIRGLVPGAKQEDERTCHWLLTTLLKLEVKVNEMNPRTFSAYDN